MKPTDGLLNPCQPILVVDDEPYVMKYIEGLLKHGGYTNYLTCQDSRQAMALASQHAPSLVILDLNMPHVTGRELLAAFACDFPDVPVIVLTGHGEVEDAVWCLKNGAFDFITKPANIARMLSSVRKAHQFTELQSENRSLARNMLADEVTNVKAFEHLVTASRKMHAIFRYIESIADTAQPVLITGDTGVGKELIAQAVHTASGRPGELVAVNMAGLDDTAFSDTLFGHAKGAFTGAVLKREGLVEKAADGTLFLDEIGDLSGDLQVKLLRLLQNREYYPLGSDQPRVMSARVVVGTNREIAHLQHSGAFRADLYYRLRTHHVHVPPLRERTEDIPLLLNHFLEQAAEALGREKPTPPPELATLLANYSFPGNVRELESMVFDAVSRHRGGKLSMQSFETAMGPLGGAALVTGDGKSENRPLTFGSQLPSPKQAVGLLLDEALRRTGGNQSMAARLLGMSRQALNRRLRDRDELQN